MTGKREIMPNLLSTSKAQLVRAAIAASIVILTSVCITGNAQAQTTEVWPTGDLYLDRANVLDAIKVSETVVLRATDKAGTPTAFNIEDIWIYKDVTIKGETLSSTVEFKTPKGSIFSDRAVVFCPFGYTGKGGKYSFAVADGALLIEELRFNSFFSTAILVVGCNSGGVVIRDNVFTQLLNPRGDFGILIHGYKGSFSGDISIESNEIHGAKREGIYAREPAGLYISNNTINDTRKGIYARRTADLHITNNALNYAKDCIDVRDMAGLNISGNTISNAKGRGIWAGKATTLDVSNNTVSDALTCIDVRDTSNGTIADNIVTGEMQRGIFLRGMTGSVVSNNVVSRVISPSWHKWWNGAIAIDYGAGNTVRNNEIAGEGRSALHLYRTHDNFVIDNDCSAYTARWSDPKENWNVCQFWDGGYSSGNTISGNIWGPLAAESRLATVVITERFGASPSDDNIVDNEYRQYNNVPGWTKANPEGPGCVLLTKGSENNFVFESGHFPRDTDAKSQVMDLGINNRVVGHDADHVIDPGIGQRLNEIQNAIDALPEEEVEEQTEGEAISLEELL